MVIKSEVDFLVEVGVGVGGWGGYINTTTNASTSWHSSK